MLKATRQMARSGFSLIEMLVVVSIIGLLLAVAVPELGRYAENQRIKSVAGNFAAALQTARVEAIRRNVPVQIVLTSSDPVEARVNDAVASRTGPNWIVRAAKPLDATTYDFVEGYATGSTNGRAGASKVVMDGSRGAGLSVIEFNPTSRVSFNPPETGALTADPGIFEFTNPSGGSCATIEVDTNPMRCLQVRVARSGQARVCDPAVGVATDPRRC